MRQPLGPCASRMAARTGSESVQMMSLVAQVSQEALRHMRELEETQQTVMEQQARLEGLETTIKEHCTRLSEHDKTLRQSSKDFETQRKTQTTLDHLLGAMRTALSPVKTEQADEQATEVIEINTDPAEQAASHNGQSKPTCKPSDTTLSPASASQPSQKTTPPLLQIDDMTADELGKIQKTMLMLQSAGNKHFMRFRTNKHTAEAAVSQAPGNKGIHVFVFKGSMQNSVLSRFRATFRDIASAVEYRDRVLHKIGGRIKVMRDGRYLLEFGCASAT